MSHQALRGTDFLGQSYGIGDFVVYATTSGRSPVQKLARVEKIWEKVETSIKWVRGSDGGPGRCEDGERRVLMIGVREIKNGRGFQRWDSHVKDAEGNWGHDLSKVRVTYPMQENIVLVAYSDSEGGIL